MSSLVARLKLLLFVVAVIAAECLVAYLYLPTASEASAMAGGDLAGHANAGPPFELGQQNQENEDSQVEVDLGEFVVVSFQPISNTTLRIDFHLFGTVASEDQEPFRTAMEENMHRLRDQVIVTVRSCELTDLTDAGLGLIKRKILEKVNRTLGKPFLQTVIFSDFSFIEQ